ncbi:UDP-galactopyranose mutase [Brevundimonas alba]|uniref:UDP-galactopyranose mutase n=1 Tax=Brevundimonas alba TaxID=74314 RepID=A0A7X5YIK5_9CAUL|nr:UDP-galactopyranose mutase [Brevundimonas alba]NJC39856.1 UDP-galactopyranose mutase [Brevundimonas alba]
MAQQPTPSHSADVIELGKPHERNDPIVCLSHLRWDFVFQRPQHLMSRFAANRTVLVFEEPLPAEPGAAMGLDLRTCADSGVMVATPRLPDGLDGACRNAVLRQLLDEALAAHDIKRPVLWYYTPMMLPLARHIDAAAVVYDCMDELANFKFAPPELTVLERELFSTADVVFTGGYSLYEAKQDLHDNIHPFPSSVDREHFARALELGSGSGEGRPRLGFFGVIDERMDLELIAAVADARPDYDFEMVGPVVKIAPEDLPQRPNLTYPGQKSYDELPACLARWDVALMPFAINESTRFISPTKTPEYLSAGRPVVSTPIRDVVRHYGDLQAVQIADTAEAFVKGCDRALELARGSDNAWRDQVTEALASLSWDQTQLRMTALIDSAVQRRLSPISRTAPASPSVWPAMRRSHYDALIVGAGFAGSVLAERLASQGQKVMLIDRRPHIGGNAFDRLDEAGVLIHQYGPHIFHTNSAEIFDYLSRFTEWRPYEHRVLAQVNDKLVPMPINRTTLNALYGLDLRSDEQAEAYLASRAEPVERIRTSEDVVVNAIGRELYETFFRGYTRKQWGLDPSELDKSVTARVPTRTNTDDRYFTDAFQAMPLHGYTRMFENMLDHENIHIETGVEYRDVVNEVLADRLVFTGPIDEFFDHRYGELPYRSLRFRHETLDQEWFQPVATVNYPAEETPYTRVTEYKHLTGQNHGRTSITYEYPAAEGDPYYPIPRPENQALFKKYEALAATRPDVTFVGRLATYRYYNMDQVTGQALATWRRLKPVAAGDTAVEGAAIAGL